MSTQNIQTSSKCIPRRLKLICIINGILLFLVFLTMFILYEQGMVGRTAPVIWEWLAILSSIVWMSVQCVLLGKADLR